MTTTIPQEISFLTKDHNKVEEIKNKIKELEQELENPSINVEIKFKFEDITCLYVGQGNCCRCGCEGGFYYPNKEGITRCLDDGVWIETTQQESIERTLETIRMITSGHYQVTVHDGYIIEVLSHYGSKHQYQDCLKTFVEVIYLDEKIYGTNKN